ncbi:MAG: hypothetical protein ACREAB_11980 [Blastocatellia bacterium]
MKTLNGKRYLLWIVIFCSLTLLLSFPNRSQGQYAKVKHIVAKTSEGVSVSVWVDHPTVKFGQDVVVKYKIDNLSLKAIYLVHEKELNLEVKNGTMSIGSPSPFPIGHGGFDYSFTKVAKGKSYQGHLTVPGDSYQGTGPWRIEVALGYVEDITDLDRNSVSSRDPAFLRGTLNERLKVVWIGNLRVDILKD